LRKEEVSKYEKKHPIDNYVSRERVELLLCYNNYPTFFFKVPQLNPWFSFSSRKKGFYINEFDLVSTTDRFATDRLGVESFKKKNIPTLTFFKTTKRNRKALSV